MCNMYVYYAHTSPNVRLMLIRLINGLHKMEIANYEEDCRRIHDEWSKGNLLVQVLGHRSLQERRQIREKYSVLYGDNLIEHLQRSCVGAATNRSNQVYRMLCLWMMEANERDAVIACDAVKNIYSEFTALTEIYACRKPNQLFLVKQAYQAKFMRSLDRDIVVNDPPSHPYQKILMALSASQNSDETEMTSNHIAKCDAKRLYEASRGTTPGGGIDDSVILEIISKRSIRQFRLTLNRYNHIYGHEYKKSLKKINATEFEESLRAVVRCIDDPPKYFAKILYISMKGMRRVDDTTLIRVMVTRAEVDMADIKTEFLQKYKKKLQDAIAESIPTVDLRDLLIALTRTPTCQKA